MRESRGSIDAAQHLRQRAKRLREQLDQLQIPILATFTEQESGCSFDFRLAFEDAIAHARDLGDIQLLRRELPGYCRYIRRSSFGE